MPELPEVETVRRGLVPVLDGVVIDRVELRRADLRFPFGNDFCARIGGQTIQRLTRRAKYLLAEFASGDVLLMHLGMTGRFSIGYADAARAAAGPAASTVALGAYVYDAGADQRHDHVVLHLAGGTRVIYNDARRFGFMVLVAAGEVAAHPFLRHLGAEPLGADLTATYLARRAAGRRSNLKAFLMDQRIVAGLGNIYVCEALYRARLSPERAAGTLALKSGRPSPAAERLVFAIRAVLDDAIAAGGSTLRDYRHADGSSGAFQERFDVYDRAAQRCHRDGCGGTIKRVVHSGRSTFFCSRCQR